MNEAVPDTVDVIARRIRPVLESDPRVRFAYLYGSRARGDARPDSDDDVDLLVVDDAPRWLQFRVVAGRVLFSRDKRERISFREHVEKAFLDFRLYHDSYLAAVRERARRGVLSGG